MLQDTIDILDHFVDPSSSLRNPEVGYRHVHVDDSSALSFPARVSPSFIPLSVVFR